MEQQINLYDVVSYGCHFYIAAANIAAAVRAFVFTTELPFDQLHVSIMTEETAKHIMVYTDFNVIDNLWALYQQSPPPEELKHDPSWALLLGSNSDL